MTKTTFVAAALATVVVTGSMLTGAQAATYDGTQRTWTGNRTTGAAGTTRTRGTANNQRGGTRSNGPVATKPPVVKPPVVAVRPAPVAVRAPVHVSDGEGHDYRRENGNRSWYNVPQASDRNDGYAQPRRHHRRWWHRVW